MKSRQPGCTFWPETLSQVVLLESCQLYMGLKLGHVLQRFSKVSCTRVLRGLCEHSDGAMPSFPPMVL